MSLGARSQKAEGRPASTRPLARPIIAARPSDRVLAPAASAQDASTAPGRALRPDEVRGPDGRHRARRRRARRAAACRTRRPRSRPRRASTSRLTTRPSPTLGESNNQNLEAPESAFDIMHVLGFTVAADRRGRASSSRSSRTSTIPSKTPADYDFADFPAGPARLHRLLRRRERRVRRRHPVPHPRHPQRIGHALLSHGPAEAAGLELPTTWAEYLAAAEALTNG